MAYSVQAGALIAVLDPSDRARQAKHEQDPVGVSWTSSARVRRSGGSARPRGPTWVGMSAPPTSAASVLLGRPTLICSDKRCRVAGSGRC